MSSDYYSNNPNSNFNNIKNRSINFNQAKYFHYNQNIKSNRNFEINSINKDLEFLNLKLKLKLLNHKISYFNDIISNEYNNDSNEIQYNDDNNRNDCINDNNNDIEIEKKIFEKNKREYEKIDNLSDIADNFIDGFNLDKTIQKSNSNNYLISQPILIYNEINENEELITVNNFNENNNDNNIIENHDNIIKVNAFDLIESISDDYNNNYLNKQYEYQPVKNIEYNYISKKDNNVHEERNEEKPNYNYQNNLQETIESTERNLIGLNYEYNINKNNDDKISINDNNNTYQFQFQNLTFKNLKVDEPEINKEEKENNTSKEKNEYEKISNNNFHKEMINANLEIKQEKENVNINKKNQKKSLNDSDDDDLIISSIMEKAKELESKTKDENLSNNNLINQKLNILQKQYNKKKNISFSDKLLIKIPYNEKEKVTEFKVYEKTNKKNKYPKNNENNLNIFSSSKSKSIKHDLNNNSRNKSLISYNNTYNYSLKKKNNIENKNERKKSIKKDIKDFNKETNIKKNVNLPNINTKIINKNNDITNINEKNKNKFNLKTNLSSNILKTEKNLLLKKSKEFSKKLYKTVTNKSKEKEIKIKK